MISVEAPEGASLLDVVRLSGIGRLFPGHDLESMAKGVWNETREDSYKVKAGDRVEIYRPLLTDPKEARRQRAARSKG